MNLSKQLIHARKAKGYTQESLAQSTNLSLRTIQRIEKGEGNPRSHTLQLLSKFLNTELGDNYSIITKFTELSDKESNLISIISLATILSAFVPLLNACVPLYLWFKNQDSKIINAFGKKITQFQILSFALFLGSILLIPVVTFLLTGQVANGNPPVFPLTYALFVLVNISSTLQIAFRFNQRLDTSKTRLLSTKS